MDRIKEKNKYQVAIVGGGIIGTSLLYVLSHYTDLDDFLLVERRADFALVNSHYSNNSQTLHFGDIETNYTLEKATQVKKAAELVKHYLLAHSQEQLFYKSYKLALAVGEREVQELEERYQEFKTLFPQLKKLSQQEIAQLEPVLVQGRKPAEKLLALYSENGFAVNYQALAKSFMQKSMQSGKKITIQLNTEISSIERVDKKYQLKTADSVVEADFVVFAVGAHSLIFAKSLGYGRDLGILPVAGNFYRGKNLIKGKVYTMQIKKLPFAAVHGDASVNDPGETRFGPTAKVMPLLERHNYQTFKDFLQVSTLSWPGIATLIKILSDGIIFRYIMKNFLYDIPWLGKRLFLKNVKKIIPNIRVDQIEFAKGLGGVRPQLVNMKTRQMEMGEAKIVGQKIIFTITPSPGASVCLENARKDAQLISQALGKNFDEVRFLQDLS